MRGLDTEADLVDWVLQPFFDRDRALEKDFRQDVEETACETLLAWLKSKYSDEGGNNLYDYFAPNLFGSSGTRKHFINRLNGAGNGRAMIDWKRATSVSISAKAVVVLTVEIPGIWLRAY